MRSPRTRLVAVAFALLCPLTACDSSGTDDGASCEGGKCDGPANCPAATQGLDLEPAFGSTRFSRPVQIIARPGDASQLYVVEQQGVVSRIDAAAANPKKNVVLDLRTKTRSAEDDAGNEAGMFSIAFHPDFDKNGEVFISYTGATNDSPVGLQSRISRFVSKDKGKTFDAASEKVLIALSQPFTNHNGGQIAFGPDGFLYIGFGDGGSAGDPFSNGQNTEDTSGCQTGEAPCALLAKILRIDVDKGTPFGIPSDNPFAGGTPCAAGGDGPCPEIFAIGIRNPWRFSFDRVDGDLWLADVGQDAFEEVDIVEKGKNYGWRFREGNACFNPAQNCPKQGMVEPVAQYGRNVGISISGGFVYRGTAIPSLIGQYVFADFGSGRMFATLRKNKTFASRIVAETGRNISAFGEAVDGELYALDFGNGQILKVVAGGCTDGSEPPPLPDHLYLSRDGVGTDQETKAYYESIGANETPTLDDWIDKHIVGTTVSEFYRNTADLGFWREMTCTKTIKKGSGGCWVRNWKNAEDKGAPGKKDLGTVAMNVSPEGFTRFYAFAPGGKLSTKAVLDSEGEKFVPRLCTPCHNGLYLGPSSSGDVGAIFREFEPSLFELPDGVDPAAAQRNWFELNKAAKSANTALRAQSAGGPTGIDHAKAAINGYIDGMYTSTTNPVALDVTDPAHVPPSWKQGTAALVAAQTELWTQAINPTCMGCHRTNTVDFAEFANFKQLGPNDQGESLLQTYLDMKPEDGKQPLSLMPQAELLYKNLQANEDAVNAIQGWLGAQ